MGMEDAPGQDNESPVSLPPLRVTALLVTKADLVAALRVYVPNLADIRPLDGANDMLLVLGPVPANPRDGGPEVLAEGGRHGRASL